MSYQTLEILLFITIVLLVISLIALFFELFRPSKKSTLESSENENFEVEKNRLKQQISMMDTNIEILRIIKEHNDLSADQKNTNSEL